MRIKKGSVPITLGLLLIAAALCVAIFNICENRNAGQYAADTVTKLAEQIPEEPSVLPDAGEISSGGEIEIPDHILAPDMEMPTKQVEGWDHIGILELPALDLTLPVISEWSYPALKLAPCRYDGSAYKDDMVIAAHNYLTHFSRLHDLAEGDEAIFTDVDGNRFVYEVALKETLVPTAIEEMTSGEWDLTLFTCTYDGRYRFTVRCERLTGE